MRRVGGGPPKHTHKSNIAMIASLLLLLLCVQDTVNAMTWQAARTEAARLAARLPVSSRRELLHGAAGPYVGNTVPLAQYGVPSITLEDGPQGVADGVKSTTEWPSTLTVTATFDKNDYFAFGKALAAEQEMKGTMVMLGPMVNLARVPLDGRAFESCGEDPRLCSAYAFHYVRGVQQRRRVMACVKHLAFNNQEFNRTLTSAQVDDITAHEIYYRPFRAAVEAGVATSMCSYNRVNGTYACENPSVLGEMKRDFYGWIMSDWGATHSGQKALDAGLDQEMPSDKFFNANGLPDSPRLTEAAIRVLTPMIYFDMLNNPPKGNLSVDSRSTAHSQLANQLATKATVLLKNDNSLLPNAVVGAKRIAMIGDHCNKTDDAAGGGSGHVCCEPVESPLAAIRRRAGPNVQVDFVSTSAPISERIKVAGDADIALICVASMSGEGHDRTSLKLSSQDEIMIKDVGVAQSKSVVILHATGGVDTSNWVDDVPSIVAALVPGSADGNALAKILFGDVAPAGRLPVTFANRLPFLQNNNGAQYPGINNVAQYSEGIYVGYRAYNNLPGLAGSVQFPFGHGLHYTEFRYTTMKCSIQNGIVNVQYELWNVGSVESDFVSQLYLKYPSIANQPDWQLAEFDRVSKVPAGGRAQLELSFNLSKEFGVWNRVTQQFNVVGGVYTLALAHSSTELDLLCTIQV